MSVESHPEHGEQLFQKATVATLPQRLPVEGPLKVPHPIPYQGSKRNLSPPILGYFPERVGTLIEPFAGSAALTLAAAVDGLTPRFKAEEGISESGGTR